MWSPYPLIDASSGEDGLIKSSLTVEWFKLACSAGVLLHTPGVTHLASAAHGATWEFGPHQKPSNPTAHD